MRILFALLCFAASIAAPRAEATEPTSSQLEACLAETDGEFAAARACIGHLSEPCLNSGEGSVTTIGMIRCYEGEREGWRALRTRSAEALRSQESPTQRAELEGRLTAFEQWRDRRCSYGASIYEGGSLARVVSAACVTRLEGELAIDLWLRVREYEQR